MSPTWDSGNAPEYPKLGTGARLRAAARGTIMFLAIVTGVLVTLPLRPFEALAFGAARPWTGWITVAVCRVALWCCRLRVRMNGHSMREHGIIVANHSSWLDIFVLNGAAPLYFVSKSEVADWPGIGWLARLIGTVFVRRDPREAGRQAAMLENRIASGHRLLFFPEGTSTDGRRVLPFKPTLFASVLSDGLKDVVSVQPVTLVYRASEGLDPRFYGWWGDMDFAPHLFQILAAKRPGQVEVTWHEPLPVSEHSNRKVLAKQAELLVRSAHPQGGLAEGGE